MWRPISELVGFEAWAELAGDSPTSRTEWAAIVAAWSEPHRRYHDLAHLAAVLGLVGELVAAADDPDAVRLAALYHDIAYEPERTDNEEVSAARARVGLRGLVPDARVDEVERLVLLTAGHDPAPDDANGAVLCDADLAVLAGPPDAYATYASAVRDRVRPPLRRGVHRRADRRPRAAAGPAPALPAARRRRRVDAAGAGQPDRGADPAQAQAPRGFRTTQPRRQQPAEQLPRADRLAPRPRRRSS